MDTPGSLAVPSPEAAAETLLARIRTLKNEFRGVDETVATRFQKAARQRVRTAREHRRTETQQATTLGGLLYPVEAIIEQVTGFDWVMSILPQACTSPTGLVVGGVVGASIGAVTMWRKHGTAVREEEVRAAEQGHAFLEAGVAVELALGELRTALDLTRRGIVGSADALATSAVQAEHAVRSYVDALQTLEATDASFHFPYHVRFDLRAIEQLVGSDTEELLAEVHELVVLSGPASARIGIDEIRRQLGGGRAAASPADHLTTAIETAVDLRTRLVTARGALEGIGDTLRHAMRPGTDRGRHDTLAEIASRIRTVGSHADTVESHCAVLEAAARAARDATASGAVEALDDALTSTQVRPAFDGYAKGLRTALAELGDAAGADRRLREVSVTLWNLSERDALQLSVGIDALIASSGAAATSIRAQVRT